MPGRLHRLYSASSDTLESGSCRSFSEKGGHLDHGEAMRIRMGWVLATATAYGVVGGWLLYDHMWNSGVGLDWTDTAVVRIAWAAVVFVVSTLVLAQRIPAEPVRWLVLHVAGAFLTGAVFAWVSLEYWMTGSEHPWDTDVDHFLSSCVSCAPRMLILRQSMIAAAAGTSLAAGLAPLVARPARPRIRRPA
jgi:hypothetical protein